MDQLLSGQAGHRALLLGNEAIVRGALEAGLEVAAAYPGTPSSEIADTCYELSQRSDLYFEYSTNEKVAFEVAAGAAIAGMRALVSMKHVGLNVAADPLNTLAYTGVRAGMVIVTADDPGLHSSQNEQDNRWYARLALLPMLEPASAQEALEMTRAAFALSERLGTAVLLRTTTRVNHTRGVVTFGPLTPRRFQGRFVKEPMRWVPVPAVARRLRPVQLERLEAFAALADGLPWNRVEGERGELGIVASGVARQYVREVLAELGAEDRVRVLHVGSVHPLPGRLLEEFLLHCEKVLVVEELEPFLETEVRAIAQRMGRTVHIEGKGARGVPRMYELSPDRIRPALARLLGRELEPVKALGLPKLPARPPMLCAGCSHRNSYYAIKSIAEPDTYFASDIGCYTLGLLPPMSTVDSFLCMGSSITQAQGASIRNPQKIVAFIGDSTFYHSGLPGLANAVHNGHDLMLVILDNSTTAMTGHQPHPGTTCCLEGARQLDLERAVRGLGVEDVQVVDNADLQAALRLFQEAYRRPGVRVLISRHACPLLLRKQGVREARLVYAVDQERCKFCGSHLSHEPCGVPTLHDDELQRARVKLQSMRAPPECGPFPGLEGQAAKMQAAPCTFACPANVCAFGYVGLLRAGRTREALALIREAVPLPLALGHVCHHPCEAACVRGDFEGPVAINALKRFAAEQETPEERRAWIEEVRRGVRPRSERVAVVGAGPAGLAAAFELARRGYQVELFEREAVAGGMLALGIPAYRMPRDALAAELEALLSIGIRLRPGEALGRDVHLKGLLADGFQAVCLAVGAWRGLRLGIPGEDSQGVEDALTFLRRVNLEAERRTGRRVLVVGGGDAAIDAARCARRLGAEEVEIVYRRSAEEMPAAPEEVAAALAEGVRIHHQAVPVRLEAEGGRVVAAVCARTELREVDDSGRRRPVVLAGSEQRQAADRVILAVGQVVELELQPEDLVLERVGRGELRVGPEGQTSHPRVFAAGDLASGPSTVVAAIASGRRAAWGIDRLLAGAEAGPPVVLHGPEDLGPSARYHPDAVQAAPRARPPERDGQARSRDFEPAALGLDEAGVRAEAERCLSCGQCGRCNNCIDNFGCPAIYRRAGKVFIDEALCVGCGICAQLCPNDAIRAVVEPA
jgi:indolepyruvate ferredoxin oxidoreductase alpha subunit